MRNIIKSTTFLALVATWLWSTAFAGIKIGLQYHTPLQFAGVRFFLAGLMIVFFFGNFNRYFTEIRNNLSLVLKLSMVQTFIQYALFYTGINLIPGALAAMIIGSSPLFIAVVAHFYAKNDKMTFLKTISILIGVAGIAIITIGRTKIEMKGEYELIGIGLLLLDNIIAGYANIMVSKSPGNISPLVLSSSSLIIGGFLLILISIPIEGVSIGPFPPVYFGALTWLSFLSAAAISIWFTLLKRPGVKVSILNVWKFLIPVSGAVLSWILIENENPDPVSITGMVAIALSLLALSFANRKQAGKPIRPQV
jgi:drug/metabolite transporter (DMT)-like permease